MTMPTPVIGAPRVDKRTVVDVSLEAPITDNVFIEGSYRFGGTSRTSPRRTMTSTSTSVKLGVKY